LTGKDVSTSSVQSIMGAQLMRLSIFFIQRIFFAIVGPVKYWTDQHRNDRRTVRNTTED
jgi:hypothetical protein